MCTPVSSTTGRQHLYSARHDLTIPRSRLARYGSRSFATSGPSTWNSLPLTVRDPSLTFTGFCCRLKTELYVGSTISKHTIMMDTQHTRDRSRGGEHKTHSFTHWSFLLHQFQIYGRGLKFIFFVPWPWPRHFWRYFVMLEIGLAKVYPCTEFEVSIA